MRRGWGAAAWRRGWGAGHLHREPDEVHPDLRRDEVHPAPVRDEVHPGRRPDAGHPDAERPEPAAGQAVRQVPTSTGCYRRAAPSDRAWGPDLQVLREPEQRAPALRGLPVLRRPESARRQQRVLRA